MFYKFKIDVSVLERFLIRFEIHYFIFIQIYVYKFNCPNKNCIFRGIYLFWDAPIKEMPINRGLESIQHELF